LNPSSAARVFWLMPIAIPVTHSCHEPGRPAYAICIFGRAFRPEASMDYPDYLRAQAAELRARAREVEEAAIARELQELAVVCEHVADELEDRQTAG